MQFVLNFPLKEHHDDGDGDDVYKQDKPGTCRPLIEHNCSSNGWADVNVHIASWLPDAAEACSFLHQPIVKARWQFFGKRDFTKDEADHAGAAGTGRAVRGESDATGFGMFNDGFARINGALAQKMRSSEKTNHRGRRRGDFWGLVGGQASRTCGHERHLIELFLGSSGPFAC
jgi:hypothetical protein